MHPFRYPDILRGKEKRKKFISKTKIKKAQRMCRENLDEYLKDSTLHGLKYVGDRTLTIFER